MKIGIIGIAVVLVVCMFAPAGFSQTERQAAQPRFFNSLYEPLPVVLRLSYENFKNIKLLNAAIINFGGGESEFDRLVEEYAEASSLYFRNEFVESANKFSENEKNILNAAKTIAEKYKEATIKLQKDVIKMKVMASMKMALDGRGMEVHPAAERSLRDGGSSLIRANDNLVRVRPITALYFYRRAKHSFFNVYTILEGQFNGKAEEALRGGRKNENEYYAREAKKHALPGEYQKDISDNKNRIYAKGNMEKDN